MIRIRIPFATVIVVNPLCPNSCKHHNKLDKFKQTGQTQQMTAAFQLQIYLQSVLVAEAYANDSFCKPVCNGFLLQTRVQRVLLANPFASCYCCKPVTKDSCHQSVRDWFLLRINWQCFWCTSVGFPKAADAFNCSETTHKTHNDPQSTLHIRLQVVLDVDTFATGSFC